MLSELLLNLLCTLTPDVHLSLEPHAVSKGDRYLTQCHPVIVLCQNHCSPLVHLYYDLALTFIQSFFIFFSRLQPLSAQLLLA